MVIEYLEVGKLYQTISNNLAIEDNCLYYQGYLKKDIVFMALDKERKILFDGRIFYIMWPEDIPIETKKIEL